MFLCLTCYLIKRFLNSFCLLLIYLAMSALSAAFLFFYIIFAISLGTIWLGLWLFPFWFGRCLLYILLYWLLCSILLFCRYRLSSCLIRKISGIRFFFFRRFLSLYILYKMNLQLAIQLIFFCILFLSPCLPPKQISFTIFLFFRMINKNIQK